MISSANSFSKLHKCWYRQIARRQRQLQCQGRRPFAGLALLNCGVQPADFVEIEQIVGVVLSDDPTSRRTPSLRLTSWGASRDPHGVQFGGHRNARLDKNMALAPARRSAGERIGRDDDELLLVGLQLEKRIYRAARYSRSRGRTGPRFPRFWAGFQPHVAAELRPSGPEFEAFRRRIPCPEDVLLDKFRRCFKDLWLLPVDWCSDALDQAVAIFAEMTGFPRLQLFRVDRLPDDLCGYRGAMSWDFVHTPWRDGQVKSRESVTRELTLTD